jgi:hypothetical protein
MALQEARCVAALKSGVRDGAVCSEAGGHLLIAHLVCPNSPFKITSAEEARTAVEAVLASEPDLEVFYVSVGDGNSLRELPGTEKLEPETPVCISLAGVLGGVRLIDNIIIGK